MGVMIVAEEIRGMVAWRCAAFPSRSRTDARQRTLGHSAGIKGSGGLVTEARDELALPSFACLVLPVPRPVTGTRAPYCRPECQQAGARARHRARNRQYQARKRQEREFIPGFRHQAPGAFDAGAMS